MNKNDNFKKWQKYKVLKKKRDLQKQANIYYNLTKEMFDVYEFKLQERKEKNERWIFW